MKNILITGCSSGIGFESARILKEAGYKVYATARKKKDVKRLRTLGFISYKLDVTNAKNIKKVIDKIILEDMKLDAVFNNAGYGQPGAVEDISTDVLRQQFETNLFGLHEVTIQAMKIFRKQGYGKLIQHSSVLGIISLKFRGPYNASKYAIEGLCDTLRQELIGSNIYLSVINTGPVTSKFRENALAKFKENIDIENSFFESTYKNEVKKRLESTDDSKAPFNLPPSSVANIALEIMNSKKPKPRYYVTKATYILGFAKRVLSTNLLDKLLNKI
ncbi:short-chain dehydrogenase [Malaciobacter molluscorum LMG 25693]|uniref:Short-chain dehydrogenase n=1 Tax=Malaciobacter molluscorum LMG 25693 TaxID=870501 RepID=A0A2G1DEZ9_9BACT|nr:SDR family NAD(P)-dependent oxidoreductase [Malaciobacter molluscorum]AXX92785.1 short-chain dehydrogenase/reductase [Malaciobacter molluscorum LMG 25693]PHO17020.1 short-chain dehydrogenase [Malaciobacter molluscorum LMG 25693]RXJ96115.1 short-chain dehydrogenase [Malaciobacter molluscorum]